MTILRHFTLRMRSLAILAFVGCAIVVAPKVVYAADVRIAAIKIPGSVSAGKKYKVELSGIQKTGEGIRVVEVCFTWDFEGPFCFRARENDGSVTTWLRTDNPRTYWLSAFLKFEYSVPGETNPSQGKSNEVRATLVVLP